MTDEEKAMCRGAIAQYKEIRPVVQQGDLYRLLSPYDGKGLASLMYVTPARNKRCSTGGKSKPCRPAPAASAHGRA